MRMTGDITIETEQGGIVDSAAVRISEFIGALYRFMPEDTLRKTHCLQFIDEFGDTTFNMLQKKVLVNELELLVSKAVSTEANAYFEPIIGFISKYNDEVHIYVKFHGD